MTTSERHARLYEPRLREMIAAGNSRLEIVRELEISNPTLNLYCRILGLALPRKSRWNETDFKRAERMKTLREQGATLEEIGKTFKLTRERVRQILARCFPDSVFPGVSIARTRECPACGKPMPYRSPRTFCTRNCTNAEKARSKITRDTAEQIMRLREEGKTWIQIEEQLKIPSLRSRIQKYLPLIFSSAERASYFKNY